ncbi:SspB family protein [Crenalkalicoccus roseus]|uniref:SspB family protein n=1 Tax=Crenalkalicoccus roseus TaxID=1485588 RepID=UPI001080450B|nr:ClpXP protease specificity-enhancing factor SspB [Crenalkalicoccus roseus]
MTQSLIETESLLPYARWAEEALRGVVVEALAYTAEHGLPGEHHFYLTFRTDHPGVSLPGHLRARYPQEMTIVLQHRFWDLKLDHAAGSFSVGLSFGGVPATLTIPFKAVTAFADPHVRFGLRFQPPEEAPAAAAEPAGETAPAAEAPPAGQEPQVVSLDAFRRRPTRD